MVSRFQLRVIWLFVGLAASVHAQTIYWDTNGATSGSGSATPTGTWDATSTFWSTDATGASSTAAWIAGRSAAFAAGTDASGAYTVTVSGTQSIGGLIFEEGSVTLAGGTLALASASTINVATSLTATVGSVISGSFALTKTGAGTLLLSGADTYTGATTINNGTLRLGSSSSLPSGKALTVATNTAGGSATFDLNGFDATVSSISLGGATGASATSIATISTGSGTLTLGSAAGVTFTATGSPLGSIISGNLALGTGTHTFNIADSTTAPADLTVSAIVSGSGNLTKSGAGTLVLSGANTYTGNTTVSAGTLVITANNALGTAAKGTSVGLGASLVFDGGTSGFNYTTAEPLTLTTLNASLVGALGNVAGNNSFAGPITLGGRSQFTIATGTSLTLNGKLSATPEIDLNGGGTLVLTNSTNDFWGPFVISGGSTLIVTAFSALGQEFGNGLTVSSGTLEFQGGVAYSPSSKILKLSGTGASGSNGALDNLSGNSTFGGPLVLMADTTIGAAAGTQLSLGGRINTMVSGFALNVAGPGTIVVSGDDSVTGVISQSIGLDKVLVSGGTLRATTNANALGIGTLSLSGGALELANDTGLAFNRDTTISAATNITSDRLTAGAAVTHTLGALSIGAQTLTLTRGTNATTGTAGLTFGTATLTASGVTFSASANTLLTFSAVTGASNSLTFTGAGDAAVSGDVITSGSLTKSGTGTLTLSGAATSIGSTIVSLGTLRLSGAGTLGAGSNTITLNGGLLDLGGLTTAAGTVSFLGGDLENGTLVGASYEASSGSAGATLSGSGATLTKSGDDTFTLSGANTYTGGTTVAGGTLLANNTTGSATGTGALLIASGATLGGSGFIAGATTVNGTLSPGNSPGLLTFNSNLTLGSGSLTLIQIGGLIRGTSFDAVDVGGTLTFGGTLSASFVNGFSPVSGQSFNVFSWTGGASGTFATLNLPALDNGLSWDTSALYTNGTLSVMAGASAIPEPSTYAVTAACVALAFATWRRRHRKGVAGGGNSRS